MEIQKYEELLFKHVATEKSDRELQVSVPKKAIGLDTIQVKLKIPSSDFLAPFLRKKMYQRKKPYPR